MLTSLPRVKFAPALADRNVLADSAFSWIRDSGNGTGCPPIAITVRGRRGFTLVEVLVVIAIVALLVGLLLPAVQKVREAAARAKCANNLKQMALACHVHHDSVGAFPHGCRVNPKETDPLPRPWANPGYIATYATYLLPYLEQQPLYDLYSFGSFANSSGSLVNNANMNRFRSTRVPVYSCPSDPYGGAEVDIPNGVWPWPGASRPFRSGSYRAVTGTTLTSPDSITNRVWDDATTFDFGNANPASGWASLSNSPYMSRGVFHVSGFPTIKYNSTNTVQYNSIELHAEKIAHILDGTSSTLLFTERGIKPPSALPELRTYPTLAWPGYWGSLPVDDSRMFINDYDECMTAFGLNPANLDTSSNAVARSGWPCRRGVSSFHPNGFSVALSDASVRFLATSMAPAVLQSMATVAGTNPGPNPAVRPVYDPISPLVLP